MSNKEEGDQAPHTTNQRVQHGDIVNIGDVPEHNQELNPQQTITELAKDNTELKALPK